MRREDGWQTAAGGRVMRVAVVAVLLALLFGEVWAGEAGAQEFSRAQAARGQQLFSAHCATCHSERQAAGLMGERGKGQTLGEYHTKLSQIMPPQSTVKPTPQGYLDIIAHLSGLIEGSSWQSPSGQNPAGQNEALVADAGWRRAPVPE